MPELADIFRLHGPRYLELFRDRLLPSHARAVRDIMECRTEALGGHVYQCDYCGYEHYAYHSCRNRHCPKCHGKDTRDWIEKLRELILPVTYFHLVFTLPQELREIVRAHQTLLLGALFQAAAYALTKLARDPRYLGGRIGIVSVLHTWTRAMVYHPHVHCLVPGGGLSQDGTQWLSSRKTFLVPVAALSLIFRAKFMELARSALPQLRFPDSLFKKEWVVYSKASVQGTGKVVNYLARYVHRVAITNGRILSMDNGEVRFRYKDSREKAWKTMTLTAREFIRRFLQHVLPRGFHKVRYYGIFSPSSRHLLNRAKQLLTGNGNDENGLPANEPMTVQPPQPHPMLCPVCKIGHLLFIGTVPPKGRDPP